MTDYAALSNEELSAEIAKRLFGLVLTNDVLLTSVYASDHNAAMGLVVPEMRKRGYAFELTDFAAGFATATFATQTEAYSESAVYGEEPRAICEAALKALEAQG